MIEYESMYNLVGGFRAPIYLVHIICWKIWLKFAIEGPQLYQKTLKELLVIKVK